MSGGGDIWSSALSVYFTQSLLKYIKKAKSEDDFGVGTGKQGFSVPKCPKHLATETYSLSLYSSEIS